MNVNHQLFHRRYLLDSAVPIISVSAEPAIPVIPSDNVTSDCKANYLALGYLSGLALGGGAIAGLTADLLFRSKSVILLCGIGGGVVTPLIFYACFSINYQTNFDDFKYALLGICDPIDQEDLYDRDSIIDF